MATIRICDWLKTPIPKTEEAMEVIVNGIKFEISHKAADELLERLQADELSSATQPPQAVNNAPAPTSTPQPAGSALDASQMLDVEIGDPFGEPQERPESPTEASNKPAQESPNDDALQLDIPDDPNKKFGIPSRKTYERVMQEAKRFEPGTLPALSPGGNHRRAADQKLREWEERNKQSFKGNVKRSVDSDINIEDR